jgi:ribosome-binding factor A
MPAPRRIARLEKLILEVAAETVQRTLRDPKIGFVTLTRVRLSPDLTQATVFWSTLGDDKARLVQSRALAKAAPVVQSIVGRAIATRTTPALAFRYDETLKEAGHLEEVFEKLKREREAGLAAAAAGKASSSGLGDDKPTVPGDGDDADDDDEADDDERDDEDEDDGDEDDDEDGDEKEPGAEPRDDDRSKPDEDDVDDE